MNSEGIQSAITAVEGVNNCVIDNIVYQVKVTHTLQAQILAMTNRGLIAPFPHVELETLSNIASFSQVRRFNEYLPSQQLVHSFPGDLPPAPSMNLRGQSVDFFGERNRQPYAVSVNRGAELSHAGTFSFQAYNSGNLMGQVPSESERDNRMLHSRKFTMNANKPTETVYSSYSQASSFEKF